jgi:hypothetical protein
MKRYANVNMLVFNISCDRMEQDYRGHLSLNLQFELLSIFHIIIFACYMLNMLTLCSYSQANYFSKSVAGGSPLDTIIQATLLYTTIYTVEYVKEEYHESSNSEVSSEKISVQDEFVPPYYLLL